MLFRSAAVLALLVAAMQAGCQRDLREAVDQISNASSANTPTAEVEYWSRGDKDNPSPRRFALLIGASVYPKLADSLQLKGPPNDVAITRTLLLDERYGFRAEEIVTLVHDNPQERRPTRANIVGCMEQLVAHAGKGDQVLILFSGHGGQQPNLNPEEDYEPDGLDEVFVPEDVNGWDRTTKTGNREVITDDLLGGWLNTLADHGAEVFLVADCCHAGSMNRGPEEPESACRQRCLPPVWDAAELTLSRSNGIVDQDQNEGADVHGNVMALFAVPSRSPAIEDVMPPGRGDGAATATHGRLSYSLNEVLRTTRRPLTYRELLQQVRVRHAMWQWSPLPYLEGEPVDRVVLGREEFPARSLITLTKDGQRLTLNAGLLHRVRPGSVFAVFPPFGSEADDQPVAHVRVMDADACTSRVELCPWNDSSVALLDSLPLLGRCEDVYLELGDVSLPVLAVAEPGGAASAEQVASVNRSIEAISADRKSLVRLATSPEEAEILALVGKDSLLLRRRHQHQMFADADGQPAEPAPSAPVLSVPLGPQSDRELAKRLQFMARAIHMVRLSEPVALERNSPETRAMAEDDGKRANVDITCRVLVKREGAARFEPVDDPLETVFYPGDRIQVLVRNTGQVAVDLTGLLVESKFNIEPLTVGAPGAPGESARSMDPAGRRLPADGSERAFQFCVDDETTGVDQLVIIAVVGLDSQIGDFGFLAQRLKPDGDQPARSMERGSNRGSSTGIGRLIDETVFEGARTRGIGSGGYGGAIRSLAWTVASRAPAEPSGQKAEASSSGE